MTTATTTAKKRVRQAKSAVKRAMPLEMNKKTAQKALKVGAIGAGAWFAGKALFSIARTVIGAALVIAAGVAAASLVPKDKQRQIAGKVRDTALLGRDKLMEQAKSLTA